MLDVFSVLSITHAIYFFVLVAFFSSFTIQTFSAQSSFKTTFFFHFFLLTNILSHPYTWTVCIQLIQFFKWVPSFYVYDFHFSTSSSSSSWTHEREHDHERASSNGCMNNRRTRTYTHTKSHTGAQYSLIPLLITTNTERYTQKGATRQVCWEMLQKRGALVTVNVFQLSWLFYGCYTSRFPFAFL